MNQESEVFDFKEKEFQDEAIVQLNKLKFIKLYFDKKYYLDIHRTDGINHLLVF
jgi:hypothetical protein